jgi:hypothetical protein
MGQATEELRERVRGARGWLEQPYDEPSELDREGYSTVSPRWLKAPRLLAEKKRRTRVGRSDQFAERRVAISACGTKWPRSPVAVLTS